MKIKLMIALVVLALVFGMALTACDDGETPTMKPGTGETIYDINLLGTGVDTDGKLQGAKNTVYPTQSTPKVEGDLPY